MAYLPPGVFDQDGCIIDNQADHIVMTVRLPKSMIRQNYALLVALTEAAGGSIDALQAPQPAAPTKAKTPALFYAALVLIAIFVPSPIFQGNSIFAHTAPPLLKPEPSSTVPMGFFIPPIR